MLCSRFCLGFFRVMIGYCVLVMKFISMLFGNCCVSVLLLYSNSVSLYSRVLLGDSCVLLFVNGILFVVIVCFVCLVV